MGHWRIAFRRQDRFAFRDFLADPPIHMITLCPVGILWQSQLDATRVGVSDDRESWHFFRRLPLVRPHAVKMQRQGI
ncbi:hypothetical protein D3C80_1374490 [compost metagenome]